MKHSSLAVAILSSMFSFCALAQGGTYSQFNVSQTQVEVPNANDLDTTGWGMEGLAGIFVNEWLSLEASTGVGFYNLYDKGGVKSEASVFSLGAGAKAHYELAESFSVYARAGAGITMTHYSFEVKSANIFDYDSSWEHTPHLNLETGIEYRVLPALGINLAYAKSINSFMIKNDDDSTTKYTQNQIKAGFTYYY